MVLLYFFVLKQTAYNESVSIAVILYLAVIQACYRISVRIMEKREF